MSMNLGKAVGPLGIDDAGMAGGGGFGIGRELDEAWREWWSGWSDGVVPGLTGVWPGLGGGCVRGWTEGLADPEADGADQKGVAEDIQNPDQPVVGRMRTMVRMHGLHFTMVRWRGYFVGMTAL